MIIKELSTSYYSFIKVGSYITYNKSTSQKNYNFWFIVYKHYEIPKDAMTIKL